MIQRTQISITDVVVVGAGPAGLATAIAASQAGFQVLLADHAIPPIDKACGEGIMPDGLAALADLGVQVPPDVAYKFRGIRFVGSASTVDAVFPRGYGYGIRRTVLHDLLVRKASDLGVQFRWGAHIGRLEKEHIEVDGVSVAARWIVGADGQNSVVRQRAQIGSTLSDRRRFGFRQHFAISPWTDFVEVYWSPCGQAYVTPVGDDEVCVALITSDPHVRLDVLPTAFPALYERLGDVLRTTRPQGAITSTRELDGVYRGNVALVGEASGSVDAITGEGMSLGFQQARELVTAMKSGSLAPYQLAHRLMTRTPRRMANLMTFLGENRGLRDRTLRALSMKPHLFAQMLSVHVGEIPLHKFGVDHALSLGWSMLTA